MKFEKIKMSFYLARQAFSGYKIHIIILTALGFLGGILGGIGVNALIPLLSFVVGEGVGGDDFISKNIEHFFNFINIDFSLKTTLAFIVILFIAKAIVQVIFSYINVYITSSYEENVRSRLFKKMTKAKWQYLLGQKLGHLERILINNVEQCKNFLALFGIAIGIFVNLIVYTFIAVNISFKVTLLAFFLSGILFLVMMPLLQKIREISYAQEKINRDVAHSVNEHVMGMKVVKALAVDNFVSNITQKYFEKIKFIKIKTNILNSLSQVLVEPAAVIFIAIIFAVAYKTTFFEFASFLVLIYVIKQIMIHMRQVQGLIVGINQYSPYLKLVLDYEAQIDDGRESNNGNKLFKFEKEFEFRDVSFSYNPQKPLLKNINFSIRKGEMVGLIGPSGAGKTTIVDLLLRLFEPVEGALTVDGIKSVEIDLNSWRKNIGYVSQDVFLINDTVANNIRFYDQSINDDDIKMAAKEAWLFDFIEDLPLKFDTVVGERGVELSTGQRQRIAIARVLARKPQILVLDEATSSLDNESEKKIQEFIFSLKGKITVFVVAHRLSTIMNSDKLLILNGGQIIETGQPADLLKDKQSYFHSVYNIQSP